MPCTRDYTYYMQESIMKAAPMNLYAGRCLIQHSEALGVKVLSAAPMSAFDYLPACNALELAAGTFRHTCPAVSKKG